MVSPMGLLERKYSGDISKIPVVNYLAARPTEASVPSSVSRTVSDKKIIYQLGKQLPEASAWLSTLAGSELNCLHALISSTTIVQGTSYVNNPLRRLLIPRPNQKVVIALNGSVPSSVTLYGAARSYGVHKPELKAVEILFNDKTNVIDLTMFEDRHDASVPLHLQFLYKPFMGSAPIHEVVEGRNNRIKDFYWKLWYGDNESLSDLDVKEVLTGPELTLDAAAIEQFCAVVGNHGESFKTVRQDKISAPMDFAIVAGWQAIIKAIFPFAIDGDLLKLVHLSNSFRMMKGAKPLQVGDVCRSEGQIVSVVNGSAGKIVKVKGHVIRDNVKVVEVVSSFLYRGNFTDYENTFEITEEPDYIVDFPTDAAVGVLLSKEWFDWDDKSKPLTAGTSLIFRIQSQVSFKDRTSFRDVAVTGDIFVRDQLKNLVKVGSVDFQQVDSHGNPVLAYLQRHGKPEGLTVPLPNDGYSLTKADSAPQLSMLLSPTNPTLVSTVTLILSTSTPTSPAMPLCLLPSPTVCGPVLLLVATSKTSWRKAILTALSPTMSRLWEWSSLVTSSTSRSATLVCTVETLLSKSRRSTLTERRFSRALLKLLSPTLYMSSRVKAPRSRVWVWTFTTTLLPHVLFGTVPTLTFTLCTVSPFLRSSRTTPRRRPSTLVVSRVKRSASVTWT
ncbi:fatty acid synthase alpha subunit Lsd1 [Stygiomarasmius scandens]|uniref:Fatty acid synthase alpha subunit Lsd1 n=1 Tax=Marasmiellus scandens TaxID=2682957 RepID=A0ABR1J5C6_9AGAR